MKKTAYDYDDYRSYLRDTLGERGRANAAFSLRSFARFAGLSPSHLSRALSGQKKLSSSSVRLISQALKLPSGETSHLLALAELDRTKDEKKKTRLARSLGRQPGSRGRVLSVETFQVLADWYHFAILALSRTKGFRQDPAWIAQRLGIKALEARSAWERLQKLKLLIKTPLGWRPADGAQLSTTDDLASAAIQENHRQHLRMAEQALGEFAVELREFGNLSLAMNLEDIPVAKQRIRDFLEEFNRDLEREGAREVCQINVQFYPLSKARKEQA